MNVNGTPYRTVWMTDNIVYLINQPKLPHHFEVLPHHDTESVAVAIETMVVRGAEAIGATGAFGLAQAASWHPRRTSRPMWIRPSTDSHIRGLRHKICSMVSPKSTRR